MNKIKLICIFFTILVGLAAVLIIFKSKSGFMLKLPDVKNMNIKSSAFGNNQTIPKKYTCQGENVNPPLEFTDIPEKAKSLALIVDDPDAPMGTWSHWIVWNIKPAIGSIDENSIPDQSVIGRNDFGKNNYGGPCPPSGTHRYFFKIYALDIVIDLNSSAKKNDLEKAMQGHIVDHEELVGLFEK